MALDMIERCIQLWSNPGDVILDPFAGLFTVVMKAIEMGRCGYGVELNKEYFDAGLKYCQMAEKGRFCSLQQ